jgi:hypothetical protein
MNEFRDIISEVITGVQIDHKGHGLWVCVDGSCVLRIRSPEIYLDDMRKVCDEEIEAKNKNPLKIKYEVYEFEKSTPDEDIEEFIREKLANGFKCVHQDNRHGTKFRLHFELSDFSERMERLLIEKKLI